MVLAVLLALTPLHPRPAVPPVGAEVDQSFAIRLPAAIPGPAVRIKAGGASILLSRELLEQLAANNRTSWNTEEERQELIAAGRARKLLAGLTPPPAGEPPELKAEALADAAYLVAMMLEAGKAVVVPEGAAAPAEQIVVRYWATHPGPLAGMGHITFSLVAPPRVFFTLSWFVA